MRFTKSDKKDLGARLRVYRQRRGLSQAQVAEVLGLSKMAVSKWERGETTPDAIQLMALARLLAVSMDGLNVIPRKEAQE